MSAGGSGAHGVTGGAGPGGDVPADAADKTIAAVLGEIVWLMSQSAEHKQHTIADLEWLVMPAILLRQFKLFYKEGRPVGAVLYAQVSEAVAAGLDAGVARLEAQEWRSGPITRVIVCIAPFGGGEQFAAEIVGRETEDVEAVARPEARGLQGRAQDPGR